MNTLLPLSIFITILHYSYCGPLRLQKRAAFYIANETACVVDNTVYSNGDPIPTDDPCEACKCRPPGFACVLKECEVKPGCRAVRRTGHCCPDYICGCEHNGRMYRDGDEIRDSQNPCYTCHCQGSSIACAFIDCFFRVDCAPEYVPGECCPRYTNCTETPKNPFDGSNPYLKDKEASVETTIVPGSVIVPSVSYVEDTTEAQNIDTTVIEIFEIGTNEPELLQRDPESVITERTDSEESSEIEEKSEESIPIEEVSPIQDGASAIETSPKEETTSDEDVEVKVDEGTADTQLSTEQTLAHHEIFTPETDSGATEADKSDHSTEVSSDPEAPLVVENVNVEPEEPSNNLEAEGLASDYGKSLKFDDTKEQENETDIEDQKSETVSKEQESQTQEPQKLLYIKESSDEILTTGKIQEETVSPSSLKISTVDEKVVNADLTSNSSSTEKVALYVAKESLQTEAVETVTTVVEVKEKATASDTDKSDISVTPTITAPLLKFNSDKLEEQKSTIMQDVTGIKNDETESTVKTGDLKLDSSSPPEIESSSHKVVTALPTTLSQHSSHTTISQDTTTKKID